jgi:hypothetical protein
MHTQQVEQFTKLGRAFDDALLGHQPSIVVDYGDVMMLPASRCCTTAACLPPLRAGRAGISNIGRAEKGCASP